MLFGVTTTMYLLLIVHVVVILCEVNALPNDSNQGLNPFVRPFPENVGGHGYEMSPGLQNTQMLNANFPYIPEFQGMEQHELPRPVPLVGVTRPDGAHPLPPVDEDHHFLTRPVNFVATNHGLHYLPRPVVFQPSPFHPAGMHNIPFSPRPSPSGINFQSSSGANIFAENVIINPRVFQVLPEKPRPFPSPFRLPTDWSQPSPFINIAHELSQPSPFINVAHEKSQPSSFINVAHELSQPSSFINVVHGLSQPSPFINFAHESSQQSASNDVHHELHPMFYKLFSSVSDFKESVDRHYARKMMPNPSVSVAKEQPVLLMATSTMAGTNEAVLENVDENGTSSPLESGSEPFHPLLA